MDLGFELGSNEGGYLYFVSAKGKSFVSGFWIGLKWGKFLILCQPRVDLGFDLGSQFFKNHELALLFSECHLKVLPLSVL